MYRRLLEVTGRTGRPAPGLTIGDSGGRHCYVVAVTSPAAIAVPLDVDQVDEVIAALIAWRAERDAEQRPFGRPCRTAQTPPEAPPALVVGQERRSPV